MVDLQHLTDELYSLPPADFVEARTAVVATARAAGEKSVATRLAALRKPTVSAWLCNQLVRREPDEVSEVIDVGAGLRDATAAGDREELRRLTRRRGELVGGLVALARAVAAEHEQAMTAEMQREIESTLTAAAADPAAAEQLLAGRLTAPLSFEGFGFELGAVPPPGDDAASTRASSSSEPGATGRGRATSTTARAPEGRSPEPASRASSVSQREVAAESARLAEETRRRQAIEEAEQALAVVRLQEADAEAELAEAERVLEQATSAEADAAAAYQQAQADLADAKADLRDARKDAAAAAKAVVAALTRLERATGRPS